VGFSDFLYQAFTGIALTILLGAAICILNRFRRQGNDLPLVRMNNGGAKKLMGISGFPGFSGGFLQAPVTAEVLGSKVLGAID
jgi:hypothetical protein